MQIRGQNDVKSKNVEYMSKYELYRVEICRVDVLQELHIVIVVMMSP